MFRPLLVIATLLVLTVQSHVPSRVTAPHTYAAFVPGHVTNVTGCAAKQA